MSNNKLAIQIKQLQESIGEKFDDLCALIADLNEKLEDPDLLSEADSEDTGSVSVDSWDDGFGCPGY
jgi:hypothetical protein